MQERSPHSWYPFPGFGLPLNFLPPTYPSQELPAQGEWGPCYPNAIDSPSRHQQRLITLRELEMMRLMNQLTEKSDWDSKVFREAIIEKWKAEALATPGIDMTERMFTYCIEELRYKSKAFRETGIITAFDGDVVKSDVVIPSPLKEALLKAVAPLEDVPAHRRDWHPASNETVLDLVHPSLFPVVYGQTRILSDTTVGLDDCVKRCGEGETLPVPPPEEKFSKPVSFPFYEPDIMPDPYSRTFQWLPCEIEFHGDRTRITSYINNLHPQKHKPLYEVIEQIINLAIPVWNHVLTPLTFGHQDKPRIRYLKCKYKSDPESNTSDEEEGGNSDVFLVNPSNLNVGEPDDGEPDSGETNIDEPSADIPNGDQQDHDVSNDDEQEVDQPDDDLEGDDQVGDGQPDDGQADDEQEGGNQADDDQDDEEEDYSDNNKEIIRPEPGAFVAPAVETEKFDLKEEFEKRGLQVIVKLANIHLTPEKPEYEGGTWHVEGQLNEHICASALYYYDNSNITESILSFRQQSSTGDTDDVMYEQDHHRWLGEIFGCEQDGPSVQYIGDVVTQEGRLVAFPNVFQHRVGSFRLVDKTKPGHRKILALFLVDPHIKIISSANVPCQQKEWWAEELQASRALPVLPNELLTEVVDYVEEFPIGLDEAKKLRLELMEERKHFVRKHDNQFWSATFSLCEH